RASSRMGIRGAGVSAHGHAQFHPLAGTPFQARPLPGNQPPQRRTLRQSVLSHNAATNAIYQYLK
ncbi:MAG: hypothetical protein AB2561_20510, partial [Candidatus Thiodiazotropha endolucinida]